MLFLMTVLMSGKVCFFLSVSCLNYIFLSAVALCFSIEGVLFHYVGLWEVLLSDMFLLLFPRMSLMFDAYFFYF